MSGEKSLAALVRAMEPVLLPDVFVFCTFEGGRKPPQGIDPLMAFREKEGLTWVLTQKEAEGAGLSYQFPSRWIQISVHSSLEAVGFLAVLTRALAAAGISVNAISAYFHDHLFVPIARADEALALLRDLAASGRP